MDSAIDLDKIMFMINKNGIAVKKVILRVADFFFAQ